MSKRLSAILTVCNCLLFQFSVLAQDYNLFDSTSCIHDYSSIGIPASKSSSGHGTELNSDIYIDSTNPLGPKAQSLRNKTYACVEESKHITEKGLWIKFKGKLFRYSRKTIQQLNGNKLIDTDIKSCSSPLKRTIKALIRLEEQSKYAQNIIQTLETSNNKFTISLDHPKSSYTLFPLPNGKLGVLNNNAYAFQILEKSTLLVAYAPFNRIGSGAEIRWSPKRTIINLAHELSHAYDANYGLMNDELIHDYGQVIPVREIRALYHENRIRQELNMTLRKRSGSGALIWKDKPLTHPLPAIARH